MTREYVDVYYKNGIREYIVSGPYQYDQGLKLRILNIYSPNIHTQYSIDGIASTLNVLPNVENHTCTSSIPNILLTQTKDIYCYVCATDENTNQTVFHIKIQITPRTKPADYQYTQEQISGYAELVAQLNKSIEAVDSLQTSISNTVNKADAWANATASAVLLDSSRDPYVSIDHSEDNKKHITFGIPAGKNGENGIGEQGPSGKDGISPTVKTEPTDSGHKITITDADGAHSFELSHGTDGADGISPTMSVDSTETGYLVTLNDAAGSQSFNLMHGKDGTHGVSPSMAVEETDDGYRVTLTDAAGEKTFDLLNGKDGKDGVLTGNVDWNDVSNKPESYPAQNHEHAQKDIEGLQEALDSAGSVKTVNNVNPDSNHNIDLTASDVGALFVDRDSASSGIPASIDADTLGGVPASKYALKTDISEGSGGSSIVEYKLPDGGEKGQVLGKLSSEDQDVGWIDQIVSNQPNEPAVSSSSRTLLWSNPSPKADFTATSISIPNAQTYDWLQIELITENLSRIEKYTSMISTELFEDSTWHNVSVCHSYSGTTRYERKALLDGDSLDFQACQSYDSAGMVSTANDKLIPYKVYGVKL